MIHHGDCLEILPTLPAESIDSIVTDPPYGLSFMGKNWDHGIPGVAFWSEALRVSKPGAHLLAFGGTRTFHRLTCAIEDAGWEIRDCIMWVYGSGFPKSHDVSKAIDREAGAEREVVGINRDFLRRNPVSNHKQDYGDGYGNPSWKDGEAAAAITAPATPAAQQWQGWGTALKPAWEPIIVARKPLVGTVAANVQTFGTGAVNVDGCRVGTGNTRRKNHGGTGNPEQWRTGNGDDFISGSDSGRWPANLIHDGSDEPCQLLGNAARFFYCAKASKSDRDKGCKGLEERDAVGGMKATGLCRKCGRQKVNTSGECKCAEPDFGPIQRQRTNHHPTVKPTDLMRYLCRLVTPPGGTVLDPFCGSGSTGKAATLEGFEFIGIEREAEYAEIARARIAHARGDMPLLEAIK